MIAAARSPLHLQSRAVVSLVVLLLLPAPAVVVTVAAAVALFSGVPVVECVAAVTVSGVAVGPVVVYAVPVFVVVFAALVPVAVFVDVVVSGDYPDPTSVCFVVVAVADGLEAVGDAVLSSVVSVTVEVVALFAAVAVAAEEIMPAFAAEGGGDGDGCVSVPAEH